MRPEAILRRHENMRDLSAFIEHRKTPEYIHRNNNLTFNAFQNQSIATVNDAKNTMTFTIFVNGTKLTINNPEFAYEALNKIQSMDYLNDANGDNKGQSGCFNTNFGGVQMKEYFELRDESDVGKRTIFLNGQSGFGPATRNRACILAHDKDIPYGMLVFEIAENANESVLPKETSMFMGTTDVTKSLKEKKTEKVCIIHAVCTKFQTKIEMKYELNFSNMYNKMVETIEDASAKDWKGVKYVIVNASINAKKREQNLVFERSVYNKYLKNLFIPLTTKKVNYKQQEDITSFQDKENPYVWINLTTYTKVNDGEYEADEVKKPIPCLVRPYTGTVNSEVYLKKFTNWSTYAMNPTAPVNCGNDFAGVDTKDKARDLAAAGIDIFSFTDMIITLHDALKYIDSSISMTCTR